VNVTAMQVHRGGGLDKIARIELPSQLPGAGEVRVRVHASSLNFHDYAVVSGAITGNGAEAFYRRSSIRPWC
jgi:NADPH:quinone reductase-like Zn-dependent oxidoreductase